MLLQLEAGRIYIRGARDEKSAFDGASVGRNSENQHLLQTLSGDVGAVPVEVFAQYSARNSTPPQLGPIQYI